MSGPVLPGRCGPPALALVLALPLSCTIDDYDLFDDSDTCGAALLGIPCSVGGPGLCDVTPKPSPCTVEAEHDLAGTWPVTATIVEIGETCDGSLEGLNMALEPIVVEQDGNDLVVNGISGGLFCDGKVFVDGGFLAMPGMSSFTATVFDAADADPVPFDVPADVAGCGSVATVLADLTITQPVQMDLAGCRAWVHVRYTPPVPPSPSAVGLGPDAGGIGFAAIPVGVVGSIPVLVHDPRWAVR